MVSLLRDVIDPFLTGLGLFVWYEFQIGRVDLTVVSDVIVDSSSGEVGGRDSCFCDEDVSLKGIRRRLLRNSCQWATGKSLPGLGLVYYLTFGLLPT